MNIYNCASKGAMQYCSDKLSVPLNKGLDTAFIR
jgi:hypothetical protein